jgi:hypothetical protein
MAYPKPCLITASFDLAFQHCLYSVPSLELFHYPASSLDSQQLLFVGLPESLLLVIIAIVTTVVELELFTFSKQPYSFAIVKSIWLSFG